MHLFALDASIKGLLYNRRQVIESEAGVMNRESIHLGKVAVQSIYSKARSVPNGERERQ